MSYRHNRRRNFLLNNKGFSLIEVLVFLTILSLVFITAAVVSTISIKNSKSAENRILATRYGEELMDWLRGQKEAGWAAFLSQYGLDTNPNTDRVYCFDTEPVTQTGTSGVCAGYLIITNGPTTIFKRQVTLRYDNSLNRVNVQVNSLWNEAGNSLSVPVNSIFAPFE